MGNRLVVDTPEKGAVVEKGTAPILKSTSDILKELFPFYLNMGMTYEQYWEKDPELAVFYRKAFSLRREREIEVINTKAFYNGLYNYYAILCNSPVLNPFSKKHEPIEYLKEPFPLSQEEAEKRKEAKRQQNLERLFIELERSAKNGK